MRPRPDGGGRTIHQPPHAPTTMLRMVPLPRFAREDDDGSFASSTAHTPLGFLIDTKLS